MEFVELRVWVTRVLWVERFCVAGESSRSKRTVRFESPLLFKRDSVDALPLFRAAGLPDMEGRAAPVVF
jgi:hypothetical protein